MATTKGKPPATVKIPSGYRAAKPAEITPAITAFARKALSQAQPIGKLQAGVVDGKMVGALTTWHYDNHVPNKTAPGEPFWHPGIDIIFPAKPLAKPKNLPVPAPSGQKVLDYDPLTKPFASLDDLIVNADSKVV